MARPTLYPKADHSKQWYASKYPGDIMALTAPVVVLHTTEGVSWPDYSGGSIAPTLTYNPGTREWRQHFPVDMSARALKNAGGGVDTNTQGAVQIELVGTCDPSHKGKSGWYFWPEAHDQHLQDVADFLKWFKEYYPIDYKAANFVAYPGSYGLKAKQRFSNSQWLNFCGVCGHQHVPENEHGDPGDFPIEKVMKMWKSAPPAPPKPPAPKPVTPVFTTAQEKRINVMIDAKLKTLKGYTG
jgi:hypothetical protein